MAFTTNVWLSVRVYLDAFVYAGVVFTCMYVIQLNLCFCDVSETRIESTEIRSLRIVCIHCNLCDPSEIRFLFKLFYFYFSLFPYFASRSTYDLISCNPVVQCPSKIPLKCLWLRVYLPVHYHRFKWCIVEWCYYTLLSSLCWEKVWKAKSVNSSYLHYIILY